MLTSASRSRTDWIQDGPLHRPPGGVAHLGFSPTVTLPVTSCSKTDLFSHSLPVAGTQFSVLETAIGQPIAHLQDLWLTFRFLPPQRAKADFVLIQIYFTA